MAIISRRILARLVIVTFLIGIGAFSICLHLLSWSNQFRIQKTLANLALIEPGKTSRVDTLNVFPQLKGLEDDFSKTNLCESQDCVGIEETHESANFLMRPLYKILFNPEDNRLFDAAWAGMHAFGARTTKTEIALGFEKGVVKKWHFRLTVLTKDPQAQEVAILQISKSLQIPFEEDDQAVQKADPNFLLKMEYPRLGLEFSPSIYFTPSTSLQVVKSIFQLNLTCLHTFSGCSGRRLSPSVFEYGEQLQLRAHSVSNRSPQLP